MKFKGILFCVIAMPAYGQIITVDLPTGEQETIHLNHIEPYTCSSYKELVAEHAKGDSSCIVARVVSRGKGFFNVNYVDAAQLNRSLFQGALYPCLSQAAVCMPSFFINTLNNLPIVEDVYYFSLNIQQGIYWGSYLGSHKDLAEENAQGIFLRSILESQYEQNPGAQARAAYHLGKAYQQGNGVGKDAKLAKIWLERCVNQDADLAIKAQGLYALADFAYHGAQGMQKDYKQAMIWYEKAAHQKADAQIALQAHMMLGQLYRTHMHAMDKAAEHYNSAIEQTKDMQDKTQAQLGLAEIYRMGGNGIPKDFVKAAELYRAAATSSSNLNTQIMGLLGLAELYHMGGNGISRNFAKAANYYEEVMAHQCTSKARAVAAAGLGDIYRLGGYGMQANPKQALAWYQKALASDHMRSQRIAQLGMAELYRCGTAGCKDAKKALSMYTNVAYCGDCSLESQAALGLGALYQYVEHDAAQAVAWYQKAAQENNPGSYASACVELAGLYRKGGQGIMPDVQQACSWYAKAADQTHDLQVSAQAYGALGQMYAHGEGNVKQDLVKAIDCYSHVATQGHDKKLAQQAKNALKELRKTSQALVEKMDGVLDRSS